MNVPDEWQSQMVLIPSGIKASMTESGLQSAGAAKKTPSRASSSPSGQRSHIGRNQHSMPIRGQNDVFQPNPRLDASRNPWVGKLLGAGASGDLPVLFGDRLKERRGSWKSWFSSRTGQMSPLVIEIGCHLGKTLVEMASATPRASFVGIDITFKRVVTAAERIESAGLKNAATLISPAQALDGFLADGEADGFVIFFPDPWSKRSQAKNRLLTSEFAKLLLRKTAPRGFLWFKTDRKEYFDASVEAFLDAGFVETATIALFGDAPYESTFERRFRLQGLPSWGIRLMAPESGSK